MTLTPPRVSRSRAISGITAALTLAPSVARAQALEKIRFSGVPTDDMTPIYFALQNDLYKKAGIDFEMIPAGSGSTATTAVIAGTYEMAKASPIAALLGHLRSLPVTIVGHGATYDAKAPTTVNMVAADSPVKTGADLNGKTGSVAGLNDSAQLFIFVWIDKNGGDSRTLKWVEIPNSAASAALAEHRVDVTSMNEPAITAAVESGKARVLGAGFSLIADRYPASLFLANAEWAAKHPDAIRRWLRVTYEAAAYTNSHRSETVALMSEVTKIPPAIFRKITRYEASTTTDPASLQPLIDVAARYKFLPRAFPARQAYWSG
jgi:NitT/TauT family transport system substrate-binding protein